MTDNELDNYYNDLINNEFFTAEELDLITSINGYNEQTLDDCLYVRYCLRSYEQLKAELAI